MAEAIEIHVATNGRMVLPRAARAALGVTGAGVILLSVDGEEVKLTSVRQSVLRAQALYRAHVVDDRSSEAFLEERRAESANDDEFLAR